MKVEILGTPFNGLGELPDIENPAEGLRQAKLVHLLKANGHNVTDLGDLSGFLCQEIRDPETVHNFLYPFLPVDFAYKYTID